MLGAVIGTACLIGLVKMARRGCGWHSAYSCGSQGCGYGTYDCGNGPGFRGHGGFHGHGYGHGHGHGHGHDHDHRGESEGGFGGRWGGQRFFLRWISEQLDATPGQEKVIAEAFEEVRQAIRNGRGEWRASREDISRAVGGDVFDESVLGGAFARQDETLTNVRKAVTGALIKVHEALDERQRRRLAEIIGRGPGGFGFGPFGAGPYRM